MTSAGLRQRPGDIREGVTRSPLLDHGASDPPVFLPQSLLEGARRQKGLPPRRVPPGCLLDMDGELLEHLHSAGRAAPDPTWPCFHTKLYRWTAGGAEHGIVAGTVGAPFAVLIAEELFASGCEALVSISSAGLVAREVEPPFFVLIDRALRDEGTSHHYLPASRYSGADAALCDAVARGLARLGTPLLRGASWTTDAPFRETTALVESRRAEGIVCVEMESAALLAVGHVLRKAVACLAHVTNAMATRPGDFEKGGHAGQEEVIAACECALEAALVHARHGGPAGTER